MLKIHDKLSLYKSHEVTSRVCNCFFSRCMMINKGSFKVWFHYHIYVLPCLNGNICGNDATLYECLYHHLITLVFKTKE